MALNLPKFQLGVPIVEKDKGTPTFTHHQWWQEFAKSIEDAFDSLAENVAAIAAAQAAADAANTAAANAQTAADNAQTAANTAQTAANNAQTTADNITDASELQTSYVTGLTLTATDAGSDVSITISNHTRHYPQPNGTTVNVSVTGTTLTGRAYSTSYYIYYDDANRTGGAVTYSTTTSEATAAQIGARHTVGLINTPAAAAPNTSGDYTRAPGVGTIKLEPL